MNLSQWANSVGVSKLTAYRWYHEGKLPVPAKRVGHLILVDQPQAAVGEKRCVVYARVSSHDQRRDLDGQVGRLTEWATHQGVRVDGVVTEIGSAMNARRPKLARLLADPNVSTIVIEHRDRLARFGVEHLEAALSAHGCRVVVMDDNEVPDDLVRDMTEVLTSFCARLYGRRGAANRAHRAIECAGKALPSQRTEKISP